MKNIVELDFRPGAINWADPDAGRWYIKKCRDMIKKELEEDLFDSIFYGEGAIVIPCHNVVVI